MRKILLICLFLAFAFANQLHAQFNNISIGAELNVPSGNSANLSPIGFGGGLKAELVIANKFALTANGSIVSFLGKRYFGVTSPTETSVPVKGGLKYYTSPNFYFEAQFGANIPTSGNAATGFAWSPGLGTFIRLRNSDQKIDLGFRYEGWSSTRIITATNSKFSTFGFIGLRAAYAFEL